MTVQAKKSTLFFAYARKMLLGRNFTAGIDITSRCNLRCRHCYQRTDGEDAVSLGVKTWRQRFEQYRRQGIIYVCFVGGEPSLRYDLLRLAENYFPFISVYTNGQKKIPPEYRRRIFLSLDGEREEHDAIRGQGAFERAVDNYRNDKRVVVYCILSKLNYQGPRRLAAFIAAVRKLGAGGLHIDYFVPRRDRPDDYDLLLSGPERREIAGVLTEELDRPDSILFATRRLLKEQLKPGYTGGPCWFKTNVIFYKKDGQTKRCPHDNLDCSHCRVWERYCLPKFNPREIMRYKRVRQAYSFKID